MVLLLAPLLHPTLGCPVHVTAPRETRRNAELQIVRRHVHFDDTEKYEKYARDSRARRRPTQHARACHFWTR